MPRIHSSRLNFGGIWPLAGFSGIELVVQGWIEDPGGPFDFESTNVIRMTVP